MSNEIVAGPDVAPLPLGRHYFGPFALFAGVAWSVVKM